MRFPKIDILVPTGRFQVLEEIYPDNLDEEIKTYSIYESDKIESAIEYAIKNSCHRVSDTKGKIKTWYDLIYYKFVPMQRRNKMKPQLLNKGEVLNTISTLKKIENNLYLNHEEQTTEYELFCAVEILLAYLEK